MTNEQIQMRRERQLNKCDLICNALNNKLIYHYDVCESGFTEFYYRLKDGRLYFVKKVSNNFLDSKESNNLSNYDLSRQEYSMLVMNGLL